ncbi:MAG: bacterial regulatory s, tetR family protein [Polaromonas sp.]|nr:bacterial regulatory s, tetR family protein [Polaromonas sp.]
MSSGKKAPVPDPARPGLRERNKLDKRTRIREAALELFQTKGFDATTTREIAEAADVGIGTIFIYANDKRDLLFLIFNDELDAVVDEAFARVDTTLPLSVQVYEVFSHFYKAFHRQALLARLLLKELVFFSEGKQAAQYMQNRDRIVVQLESLARAAIARKALPAEEDPARIAQAFFFLYSGEVRLWLSDDEPDLRKGLAHLKSTFSLLGRGLGEGAPKAAGRSTGRKVAAADAA